MALHIQLLNKRPLSFRDTTFLHSTLAIFLNFFHPDLIFTVTAFCTPPPKLRISSKYENLITFSITSPSRVTSPSLLALPVKPEHFLLTKSTALLRLFHIPEHFCTCLFQGHNDTLPSSGTEPRVRQPCSCKLACLSTELHRRQLGYKI